jgi:putative FmdB family regulatory protein
MPLYEYQCRACDHQFELLVRESTKLECPKCAATELSKQWSVAAVTAASSAPSRMAGPSPCGACGDPRGAGSCNN